MINFVPASLYCGKFPGANGGDGVSGLLPAGREPSGGAVQLVAGGLVLQLQHLIYSFSSVFF